MARFGDVDLLLLLIHGEVTRTVLFLLARESGHQRIDGKVQFRALIRGTGNDQWGSRLIDEDGVHFIDHRKGQGPLYPVLQTKGEIVAQVVETEFVVGAVVMSQA